uniref:NAC transcription factor 06 n=1 Tax=Litchi chinensis TaxID=151069 RepID=A0A8K1MBF2_LITCN|nr:NAC transcription factor 06 [Litchi chinensis]
MSCESSSKSLAPGFRFHPTDEELVRYYLKRKVCNKPFRFDAISVIDIYRSEPWDLPDKSRLKSRDLEWYFFSMLDKKYGNGSRTNRATEKGYWKTTGKDRPILHNSRTVGMKKTLVYHLGRAPRGERTNWVMHEYRLVDEELEKAGILQDSFVLCRIFQKSGSGPKNGEQYGAPFIEEEWEDDEMIEEAILPGQEMVADEVAIGDYVDTNDLEQNVDIAIQSEDAPPPSFFYGDSSNFVEHSRDFSENERKPIIGTRETRGPELLVGQQFSDLPEQYEMDSRSVKNEYVVESGNNVDPGELNYLLEEPFMDATANPPFSDGLYLEANDLSNTIEPDSAGFDMVDEYLNFFDANDDNLTFDASEILGSEINVPNQALLSPEVNGDSEQSSMQSQHLPEAHGNDDASSSKQKPETSKFESDVKHPFLKQASQMLGGIHAPPAFASEFPTKDAALRLNSMAQASSSVHVTAGMIRIRNVTLTGTGMDWSFGKNGDVNIILSFDVAQTDVSPTNFVPVSSSPSGKTGSGSVVSRSLFLLMFFWVLILSVSFKIGSYIYTK